MTHRSLKLTRSAILLAFLGIAQAANAVASGPNCDTAQATEAGRQAAVKVAYADISTVRQAAAGTGNDGYARAAQQRQDAQRCMFNASDTMGDIVRSGGDLSGLVNQLSKLLSSSGSGCLTNMDALSQAAARQAKTYAQQQANKLTSDINTQVSQQVSQQVGQALTNAPIVVTPALPVGTGVGGQLTQQQINQAWGALSNMLNRGTGSGSGGN